MRKIVYPVVIYPEEIVSCRTEEHFTNLIESKLEMAFHSISDKIRIEFERSSEEEKTKILRGFK